VILATTSTQNIAVVIGVVLALGWLVYLLWNVKRAARPEVGSEIELAPNRKPYLDDDQLEGPKLERTLLLGLGMLVIIAIGLPLIWLNEPGRQAAAINGYNTKFASWGAADFATTADGGFNCAGCHGGMKANGGVAPYTITDPRTGQVVAVNWTAPALNTVLYRFSEDEVLYILTYGRPFSPMSPWGVAGGGPMDDQQLSDLIEYLKSIQVPMEGCPKGEITCDAGHLPSGDPANPAPNTQAEIQATAEQSVKSGQYKTLGEALFNLNLNGGAYSCARCHTQGWSYGDPQLPGGGSALGPNLTNGDTVRQFPDESDHIDFVESGSEDGKKFGMQGQGTGRMPAFGQLLTDAQIKAIVEYERSL
jgi:mono/diheme cytochrome c family protein